MLNISDLRKRYDLQSDKAVIDLIKEHLEQINFQDIHAKTISGSWTIDDEGIKVLDSIMSYSDDEESDIAEPEESQPEIDEEAFKCEITKLKETIEGKDEEIAELTEKLNSVNEKFLSLKDGSDEMTSNIVKEYLSRKEKAEEKLKAAKNRYAEEIKLRDKHIEELEKQIEKQQIELDEYCNLLAERTKAIFNAFQKQNQEKKLYAELRKVEKERCELYQNLSQANNTIDETGQLNERLIGDITTAIGSLSSVMQQLQKTVDDNEKMLQLAQESDSDNEDEEEPQAQDTELDVEQSNVTSIDTHRQYLMEKTRKEQNEAEQTNSGIFKRIASFFSFF